MNFDVVIEKTEKLAENIYFLRLRSERISAEAVPGQFVNIKCHDGLDAFLRRPISIMRANPAEKTFDIVYMVRGKGTRILSCLECGDTADCVGPLGRGFTLPEKGERICVIGGGIGVFPLLFCLNEAKMCIKPLFWDSGQGT